MEYKVPKLPELSKELRISIKFLIDYCADNGVNFFYRKPTVVTPNEILIIASCKDKQGVIGYNTKNEFKIYYKDEAIFKWALLEGFDYEEIPNKLPKSIREVSLNEMAALLIK
jgi:hypothetical protein